MASFYRFRPLTEHNNHTIDELKNQKLRYKIECLKSITFGARTPQNKRDEIIKIIDKKCEEHNHKVDLYEVYIDESCGQFKKSPLKN